MGRPVRVEWHKKDRYGRLVSVVFVDGLDAGLEQVHSGVGWHYKAHKDEQSSEHRSSYAAAEDAARVQHRGQWMDLVPVAP